MHSRKLILRNEQSPGDIVMLTAAVRDLRRCHPGAFRTDVRTPYPQLWENNPFLSPLLENDPAAEIIQCHYPLIQRSNQVPCHFIHGFIHCLNERLRLAVQPTAFKGDVHLSAEEKNSDLASVLLGQLPEGLSDSTPIWIVAVGGKQDFTIKWWETRRYQEVVDHFRGRIQFVQVGGNGHYHPALDGVIDLRAKTDLRQLIRLVYHAQGVLTSVSLMMHLAAAVPLRKLRVSGCGLRVEQVCGLNRACVVIAGGREPVHWEAYPTHQFIHTIGALPCCKTGGCWRSRTVPLGDRSENDHPDKLCVDVVQSGRGGLAGIHSALPRCMDMITSAEVIRRIEMYLEQQEREIRERSCIEDDRPHLGPLPQATGIIPAAQIHTISSKPAKALIIQQATGSDEKLLDLSGPVHRQYAEVHGFAFWSIKGDVQAGRAAHWNKIVLIQKALKEGYDLVIWLDADALIVDWEADLREALPDGPPIGMCEYHGDPWEHQSWHYNSGVMFVRNTPLAHEFFEAVWKAGEVEHPWHEQVRILELIPRFPGAVQSIEGKWNAHREFNRCREPVIKAWHGLREKALNEMREAMWWVAPELRGLGPKAGHQANQGPQMSAHAVLNRENARDVSEQFIRAIPEYPGRFEGRGIVIPGGGRKYFTNAWVCINMLRRLGCKLPIQIWYLGDEECDKKMKALVAPLDVECVNGRKWAKRFPARILNGWEIKSYSIIHCPFKEILLLDADNVPVLNPEYLFETAQFHETGAIFWPDVGRLPAIHAIWSICGVPYRNEPEFETGQVLVNKEKCWEALALTMWYNEQSDFFYRHIHGDKETFHLAWRKLNQPYSMPARGIERLPETFCQHDFEGNRVFQHRTRDKWNFFGENKTIPGFLQEIECRKYLEALRRVWDGRIKTSPFEKSLRSKKVGQVYDVLVSNVFDYHQVGFGHRPIRFLRDGRIGEGKGNGEASWALVEKDGDVMLEIHSEGENTCRLRQDGDGKWKGRWFYHEKKAIELVALSSV